MVDFKANWQIILFITLFFMIYVVTSVAMYDPVSVEKMEQMFSLLPEGMLKAFGFDNLGTDMTGYLAHYLYGFIAIVFPLIYIAIAANKLMAKHVDSGSMAYLLTTPVTRIRIATTQAVFHFFGLFLIFFVNVGMLLILSGAMFPGLLDVGRFLALNFVTITALAVTGGIGFLFSCYFNDSKNAMALGAGIPVAFFVFKMVSEIGKELEALRFLSVFSVIQTDRILANPSFGIGAGLVLLCVAVALYSAGVIVFNRKSLAI
jgi:ABC-2 type transport system permease protein